MRAGDLPLLSGLCAADGNGLIRASRVDPAFPYPLTPILAQTEWILDQADALCRAAGTQPQHRVARRQLFYTALRDVAVSFRTLAARFGDGMPATSVVRVPATLVPRLRAGGRHVGSCGVAPAATACESGVMGMGPRPGARDLRSARSGGSRN